MEIVEAADMAEVEIVDISPNTTRMDSKSSISVTHHKKMVDMEAMAAITSSPRMTTAISALESKSILFSIYRIVVLIYFSFFIRGNSSSGGQQHSFSYSRKPNASNAPAGSLL